MTWWDNDYVGVETRREHSGNVLQKLNIIDPQFPSDLVGIHKHIAKVESLLRIESTNVCIVGIWGMGGIGKTTMADVLFKRLCSQFDGCCFIENVREEWTKQGKHALRNKILTQVLGDPELNVSTPNISSTFAVKRLQRRKVFIILDDVIDSKQIEDLVGKKDWFGPGSRIIVTTRDKNVLKENDGIYKVLPMEIDDACHLFNLKAFKQGHPKEEFTHLSNLVVNYAKGIPLTLKVLGSLLYLKCQREWESILQKLEKVPNAEIHHVLSLSYEGLDLEEQSIFLDIACGLKGYAKWHIIRLLNGCNFSTDAGLISLQNKSLITISKNHIVGMHDLIQEMGWQIVHQDSKQDPERWSRLWEPDAIYHVLKHKTGTYLPVESIFMDMSEIKDVNIAPQAFARMHKLRLLKFYLDNYSESCNVNVSEGLEALPDNLRYFCWDRCPLRTFPSSFCAEMLVEVNISFSSIEKLWDGEQDLANLKSLGLSCCANLLELPNLSKARTLEEIHLDNCTSLRSVSSSVLSLDHLLARDLSNCTELQCIRSDLDSKSLRWLNLNGCSILVKFSVTSEKLEYLSLCGTSIEEFPSSVGRAKNLLYLSLSHCQRLESLPQNFYQMGFDVGIYSCDCPKLEKLPPILNTSMSITSLWPDGCSNVSELPHSLGLLSSLEALFLRRSGIEILPESIKLLSRLKALNLRDCKRLQSLPELPLLTRKLDASGCISLQTVSSSAATALIQNSFGSQNRSLLLGQFQATKVSHHFQNYQEQFEFYNCGRLDEKAQKTIVDEAIIRTTYAVYMSLMPQAYVNPYYHLRLCFKDSDPATFQSKCRRALSSRLGDAMPNWFWHQWFESSTLSIKLNGHCCSHCKNNPIAFGVFESNEEEISNLGLNGRHEVCVGKLKLRKSFILSYDKLWYNDVRVCLPGSRVPNCFKHRTTQNYITIQISQPSHLLGFAFCVVLKQWCLPNVICECFLEDGKRYQSSYKWKNGTGMNSDHIFLWHNVMMCNRILETIKEEIANDWCTTYNPKLSFRFYVPLYGHSRKLINKSFGIKECGVWPVYENSIEQVESSLQTRRKKLKK